MNGSVYVRAAAQTDRGLVRPHNEDAFLVAELSAGRRWDDNGVAEIPINGAGILLAVSDGMGGAKAGEVAAALSLEALLHGMTHVSDACASADRLRTVIEEASRRVREAANRPDRRGMGATLTAVQVCGSTAYVAQIGDSRAYLLRGQGIWQVTHDQSYVQMLVDAGILSPEQAERSPQKNIITQVMGQNEDVKVDLGRLDLKAGDRLLVCSDGLSNKLSDQEMLALAASPAPLEGAPARLVDAAKRAGGDDNITVILAEIAVQASAVQPSAVQ